VVSVRNVEFDAYPLFDLRRVPGLESRTGTAKILIIEHVEQPTPN
jgi:hypothetical protein